MTTDAKSLGESPAKSPGKSPDKAPVIPQDRDGPAFREPWEAEVFALAVGLHEAGHLDWGEWAAALAAEIRAAEAAGAPDLAESYFRRWLTALERHCAAEGISDAGEMARRKAAWRAAHISTPHGQPVRLNKD